MTTALTTIGGLLGQQSHREVKDRPSVPSAIAVVGSVKDKKTSKRISQQAREERLWALLTQPEVVGMVMTFAGVIAANNIPFSGDEKQNDLLQGIMTTASVAMGLGYAGVGDLTGLAVAVSAGGASVLGSLVEGGADAVNPFNWKWPLGPVWNW